MFDDHKAQARAALLLSVFLFGCEDTAAKAAQDKIDCFDAGLHYRGIVDAMCTPWSERRGMAISHLAEDAQKEMVADQNSDPSEDIFEIASHVTAKDCVRAGFPDPGEKIVDPKQHRPLPPGLVEQKHVPAAHARAEAHAVCDLWSGTLREVRSGKGSGR